MPRGGRVVHIVEQCKSCGSHQLEWQKDNGWLTGSVRYLRCTMCSDCVRIAVGGSTWIMLSLAAMAAIWGWFAVIR